MSNGKKVWRTQFTKYNPKDYGLKCSDVSRTIQSERDLFNPNFVMKLYRRTGDKSVFMKRQGIYADISQLDYMNSFSDVVARMDSINELFMTLPALEREKFGNNPMRFLDFANNPANLKWLAEHGFVELPDQQNSVGSVSGSTQSLPVGQTNESSGGQA